MMNRALRRIKERFGALHEQLWRARAEAADANGRVFEWYRRAQTAEHALELAMKVLRTRVALRSLRDHERGTVKMTLEVDEMMLASMDSSFDAEFLLNETLKRLAHEVAHNWPGARHPPRL
jgi:hypothetical protein